MKQIKYKFLSYEINHGTEEIPVMEQIFLNKSMVWNETNEEIAKREAYNGEYTIEDVPQSADERIAELKRMLSETDYVVIKIAEGVATSEEYADVIADRSIWRAEINELEKQ